MARLKIAVYAIAKDEQKFARRFMDGCSGADIIVVGVDPGDTTGDILADFGAKVVRVSLPKFRFDHYRNEVLKHVPEDIDVCVSLDLDEVPQKGWREEIEKAWVKGTTRLHYKLQWSEDSVFEYDRIHARHGYIWRHANHEGVYAIRPEFEKSVNCDLKIYHYPDNEKDRSKNIELLEMAVEEEPESQRMRWYLAREYLYLEKYRKCIFQVCRYLDVENGWQPERSWACIFAAKSYYRLGHFWDSEAWFCAAINSCQDLRDPYFEFALMLYRRSLFQRAIMQLERALKIPMNIYMFHESTSAYNEWIYILKGQCHSDLGNKRTAVLCAKMALRVNPDSADAAELLRSL